MVRVCFVEKLKMKLNYIFLDTETSGLLAPDSASLELQPHMTELSMVRTDEKLKIIDEFHSMFKIPIPLSEMIVRITGITDEMLKDKKTFLEQRREISKFMIGSTHAIGHNVNFDMDVLKFELRRINYEHYFSWPMFRKCTVELSFPIKNKRMKLSDLYKLATGKTIEGAHRSKADTLATIECYKFLKENGFV